MSAEEGGAHCARNSDPCTTVLHADGAEIIPDCVVGIHGFWRERRAPAAGTGDGTVNLLALRRP